MSEKVFIAVAKDIIKTVDTHSLFYHCVRPDYDIKTWSHVEILFCNRNMHALGTEIRVAFKKDVLVLKVTGQYRNSTKSVPPLLLGDPNLGETLAKALDDVG